MSESSGPSLAQASAGAFTSRASRQGRQYFAEGRVAIEGADRDTVLAHVKGSRPEPYLVAINFADVPSRSRLQVQCNCAFFKDGFPCKHLYATLLAIESAGIRMVNPAFYEGRLDLITLKEDISIGRDPFFDGKQSLAKANGDADDDRAGEGRDASEGWEARLAALRRATGPFPPLSAAAVALGRAQPRQWRYVINPARSEELQALVVEIFVREKGGTWAPYSLDERSLATVPNEHDRSALELLAASPLPPYSAPHLRLPDGADEAAAVVASGHRPFVLPALVATNGLVLANAEGGHETPGLSLDGEAPWQVRLRAAVDPESDDAWLLETVLMRGDQVRPATDVQLLLRDGLAVIETSVTQVEVQDSFHWVRYLRKNGNLRLPATNPEEALRQLCTIPNIPDMQLPEPWRTERAVPQPQAVFETPKPRKDLVGAEVRFGYGDVLFQLSAGDSGYVNADAHTLVLRDPVAERKALEHFGRFGASVPEDADTSTVQLPKKRFDAAVRGLVRFGWRVEARGGQIRGLSNQSLRLVSGQDWFDLEGEVVFDDIRIDLPELLRAVRQGDGYVRLDDGTHGILPEDWIKKYAALASLGAKKGRKLRFARSQAILLDMMLTEQNVFEPDQGFVDHREHIRQAGVPEEVSEPEQFDGQLRTYQREGLGWLIYLERLGLSGCLADDMGLGKTVQLLALLALRKNDGRSRGPSLVVAPRSLVFNWVSEAKRFAPALKVLDYTGLQRAERLDDFAAHDLVVTTYGTVRRDIELLRLQAFDYVILDEAQAIKNASAQSSKACRLLQGRHRLALSGTPVENHLAELWSIFEFLNPGMLGSRREFAGLARPENQDALMAVSRGLRPLILRRTKKQVLQELPEKTELTIHVRLDEEERRMYDELREHYRTRLKERISRDGFGRARMHVLEALLRLRQAACHPGLVDPRRASSASSKVETLLEQLREVLVDGHKVLVFSQFVQLLEILKKRLDADGYTYAYLDGRTRDRAAVVDRFQADPECSLFLISLKVGGLGLNLTAADYVYILDPWWNPAAEAQAIDRAHRIGQTRSVFAYRLIAEETVEDKIVQMQRDKRRLAQALISEDNAVVQELSMEDLERLLS